MPKIPPEQRSPFGSSEPKTVGDVARSAPVRGAHYSRGPPIDELRLIDRRGLAELFGVSLTTIDKLRELERDFPKPIQISAHRLAWRAGTVAAWLAAREQAAA